MNFDLVTIFPEFFAGPLDYGIVRRARTAGIIEINVHDLRAYTHDRHRTVDDRPFGGGEGMVLKPEPVGECIAKNGYAPREKRVSGEAKESIILLSAGGRRFDQAEARALSKLDRVMFLCGRYEGVDERITELMVDRELCIGDFVMSGGELGAMIILDCVTRLLPGALGNQASSLTESFSMVAAPEQYDELGRLEPDSTAASGGLLDYPHYTRPAEYEGVKVPEVLMNGNHEEIKHWRRRQSLARTLRNRPDLLQGTALSDQDRAIMQELARDMGLESERAD